MYLPENAPRWRVAEAEAARRDRLELLAAWSRGEITRRELLRTCLVGAGGAFVLKSGLAPRWAYAKDVTTLPRSPVPRRLAFTQPMPRLDVLNPIPFTSLFPVPTEEANTDFNEAKGIGPVEGRPPGPDWAHQRWSEFVPREAYEVVALPAQGVRFHPELPMQRSDKVWAYGGTFPPKLIKARYGRPILLRLRNGLPLSPAANGGFGRNELTMHLHGGHTPAESDGFAGAFFFPGQFYDYHFPNCCAGYDTINTGATDPRCGGPDDGTGVERYPGDYRETQSTMWFHDHRFNFTAQNVYKGLAGMMNLYSALDRGNEEIDDGVNLRLPSGTALPFGNLDYDVNLVIADKAFDRNGQLAFDIFDRDGFLGDVMTVNGAYKPYFEVERRKYRFRILNAAAARFFTLALSDGSQFWQIANDGNLLARPLRMSRLGTMGNAERFEIVVDFSRYKIGQKVWLVNLAEHDDGRGPKEILSVREAMSGDSDDPCVGSFLEFRVVKDPDRPDVSQVPDVLVPLPDRVPAVRERRFEFGRSDGTDNEPWTIKVDGGKGLTADLDLIAAAPKPGTAEIWHLENGGGGWDHPIHIHFEEGLTIRRDGGVPAAEALARKDVWRLGEGGEVSVQLQFREFTGMFVEHCHNTTHEDHAMLLRWDIQRGPSPLPTPIPTPAGVTFIEAKQLASSSGSGSGSGSGSRRRR